MVDEAITAVEKCCSMPYRLFIAVCGACAADPYPSDTGVEMTPPAPHALLISSTITVASNLSPAPNTKRLDKLNQLGVFLGRPLVSAYVWIHLQYRRSSATGDSVT